MCSHTLCCRASILPPTFTPLLTSPTGHIPCRWIQNHHQNWSINVWTPHFRLCLSKIKIKIRNRKKRGANCLQQLPSSACYILYVHVSSLMLRLNKSMIYKVIFRNLWWKHIIHLITHLTISTFIQLQENQRNDVMLCFIFIFEESLTLINNLWPMI